MEVQVIPQGKISANLQAMDPEDFFAKIAEVHESLRFYRSQIFSASNRLSQYGPHEIWVTKTLLVRRLEIMKKTHERLLNWANRQVKIYIQTI